MFDSLHNVTLSRPRIVIESLLEHFIFLNFLGGAPQTPRKERLLPINIYTIKFRTPPFTNPIYTHVMTLCNYNYNSISIYKLYLSSSIIKNVTAGLQRFFYLMLSFCLPIRGHICPMTPINNNWVLNNHDHEISLHCSIHHLKHHNIG